MVTCKMGASAKGRVVLATVNVYNRLGSLWMWTIEYQREFARPESTVMESICRADCPLGLGVTLDRESECPVYSFLSRCARFKHYVGVYHASLTKETKDFVYRNFVARSSEMQCLCATIAFGLVSSSFSVQSLLASFSHLPREWGWHWKIIPL